jgi:mannose-6-phosphate isomerase-like protein (cupin superfamily)
VQSWKLTELAAPDGTRDPLVLATADGARAVMIAISAGQALREHEVKERAWVTIVDGTARIECGGETVDAGPGTFLTFEPSERHSIASDGGARILLLLAPWPGEGHYRGEAPSISGEKFAGP